MRNVRWLAMTAVLMAFALGAAACSDVENDPEPAPGGGDTAAETGGASVAQCGGETLVIAVNPWVGAEANANVVKVLMENEMGCTVELQEVNENAQFPGMAAGDIDATLEVWPSGHAAD